MLLGKIFPLAREGARLITSKRSDDMPLKLVPSGTAAVADFLDPRKRRFYIDKSSFIPILEDTADVVALLRPQRWGKTVFLGVLANYYDISNAKSPFICIPGGDTSLAHSFSILRFDLALAARSVPATATVEEMKVATKAALDSAVMTAALDFVTRYKNIKADFTLSPLDLLIQLAHKARVSGAPLYVLVDEYDALLRTLAITSGNRAIDVLAGRQGPLREFFGRFKSLHDTGILPRIFLTGISPMGLDTMTTGFNIVTDVSQDAPFNGAIGFTNSDLEDALFQCLGFPKQSDEQKLVEVHRVHHPLKAVYHIL